VQRTFKPGNIQNSGLDRIKNGTFWCM